MQRVIVLLSLIVGLGTAEAKPQSFVYYGEDSRVDYFEITNSNIQQMADSTVMLVYSESLDPVGSKYYANVKSWSQEENYCSDQRYALQPALGFCSGSLIAPDLVLTAGHCLSNFESCQKTSFVFDFNVKSNHRKSSAQFTFDRDSVYSCRELVYRANSQSMDFAVVRLDRPVPHRAPLKMTSSRIKENSELFMLGYPMGIPLKYANDANVRKVNTNTFTTNLDAFGGNSGSPVFSRDTNELLGILVSGEDDTVYDKPNRCYRTKYCEEDGCRGETVMKITVLRDRLGI
jgi:hypothetical protein